MLSVRAGIGTNRGNKQADAAEVQRARSCASSGCFINVQVNSGNKFFFFFSFLSFSLVNFLFYFESQSPEQDESPANRPADKTDANQLIYFIRNIKYSELEGTHKD